MTIEELQNFKNKFMGYTEQFITSLIEESLRRERENECLKNEIQELKKQLESYENKQSVEVPIKKELWALSEMIDRLANYFQKDNKGKIIETLSFLIKHKDYYKAHLSKKYIFQLLTIASLYDKDEALLEAYPVMKAYLEEEGVHSKLQYLMKEEKKIRECQIVVECVNNFISEKKKSIQFLDSLNKGRIIKSIKSKYHPYCRKLIITKGTIATCDEERAVLQSGQVFVKLSNGKYILISVKYCPKCNRCYLSNIASERIHRELGGGVRLVAEIQGRLLYSAERVHIESQGITKNEPYKIPEVKLNVQSPLKALGYDTTKSDKERWRILQQLAIPKLGKRKVIYYLEMFIRMGKNNSQKTNAVEKWQYDLNRLK